MTKDQAKIILLENALNEAQNTVEFLHGCLTSSNYSYNYPAQTLSNLKNWYELVPKSKGCVHSFDRLDCPECQDRKGRSKQLTEARKILS